MTSKERERVQGMIDDARRIGYNVRFSDAARRAALKEAQRMEDRLRSQTSA